MNRLNRMLLSMVVPAFLMALASFTFLVLLSDLFAQLGRYLNQHVPAEVVLRNTFFFIPTAIAYSLPTSLLFAVSFSMGTLYSQNELIAIFGSGVSLQEFVKPLLILGAVLSLFFFFFYEASVVPSVKTRDQLVQGSSGPGSSNNSDITLLSDKGRVVYNVGTYNDQGKTMSNVVVIFRDKDYHFAKRVDAVSAEWKEKRWVLSKCRVFRWDDSQKIFTEIYQDVYDDAQLFEKPETFRRDTVQVAESTIFDLAKTSQALKDAGLPFRDVEVELYHRFSFALTPLAVALLSSAMGGRFKKNVILLSMASSLGVSVIYYVIQMLGEVLSKAGALAPPVGAFFGIFATLFLGLWAFRKART